MADEKDKGEGKRLGFKGKVPYPGVDPKTGERITVTLQALKDEFGDRGGEMYRSIGQITGARDPFKSLAEYAPDISLVGASKDILFKVDEVLSAKE